MKKTLHIDEALPREAKLPKDAATVRLGPEAMVRQAACRRLRELRGSEPRAQDVPRRREKPPSRRMRPA